MKNILVVGILFFVIAADAIAQSEIQGPPSECEGKAKFGSPLIHWYEIDRDKNETDLTYREGGHIVIERGTSLGFKFTDGTFSDIRPKVNQVLISMTIIVTTDTGAPFYPDKIACKDVGHAEDKHSIDLSKYNQEGSKIWIEVTMRNTANASYTEKYSFIIKRYKLRLLVDVKGKSSAEIAMSVTESATKSQVKIAKIFGGGIFENTMAVGYAPLFHWQKRHDTIINTIIDNINFGAAIPFSIDKEITRRGWGLGFGIWTNGDEKSAIQLGYLFLKRDYFSHDAAFVGFDIPILVENIQSVF